MIPGEEDGKNYDGTFASIGLNILSLEQLLNTCTSFRHIGCVLCWLMVIGVGPLAGVSRANEFLNGLVDVLTVKTRGAFKRKKGSSFPLREGDLGEMVEKFQVVTFDELTKEEFVQAWFSHAWIYLVFYALNSLHGPTAGVPPGRWTVSDRAVAKVVGQSIFKRAAHDVNHEMSFDAWKREMSSRNVGYSGEEVGKCIALTYEQVEPALPLKEHGGSVDALDWVGPRSREFLLNPKLILKDPNEVVLPRMPGKVHIVSSDRVRIANALIDRGICDWLDLDAVYRVDNVPILNGLFGVEKAAKLPDGRPVLRLIMNLVGSNSTQFQLEGSTSSLPSITAWQSVFIDQGETLTLHQSDMSSAFYLFKLPRVWLPHLAFNIVVAGDQIGRDPHKQFALCSCVLPMGWLSSVGLMQEISENILKSSHLAIPHQISRHKPLPIWFTELLERAHDDDVAWWHVYLDNFACGERVVPSTSSVCASLCHEIAENAWHGAGIVTSDKKKVVGASRIVELGAEVDGVQKTLGISTERLVKLMQSTLWCLYTPYLNRKHLQIICGRWVFAFQFRRPAMCLFDQIWQASSGKAKITAHLKRVVRSELFNAIFMGPLLHCHLGAKVSSVVTASDASESGGAVGFATSLSKQGEDYTHAAARQEGGTMTVPVMVLSLFNGIGGAFRAYDVAGILPRIRIAVECDKAANRVTTRRWPGVEVILDVKLVDQTLVKEWARRFTQIEEIHLWAGFPCVDLSSAKSGRLNLEGPGSSLFWEIPRITGLLREVFGDKVVVKEVLENVASMDKEAALEISATLQTKPYLVDSVQAVPMRRPRYCWTTEKLVGLFSDISFVQGQYWVEVIAKAEYPSSNAWLAPGAVWHGEQDGAVFPTAMKAIKRRQPPPRPAGLARCSADCVARWEADEYRFPPYQYDWKFVITRGEKWRLINADERELLLGYGWGHTLMAMSASEAKRFPGDFEDKRLSLLGDSFSIYSFVLFAVACCRNYLPVLSYQHLAKRMGLAPGFRAFLKLQAPISRTLKYGTPMFQLERNRRYVSDLNRILLRRTNHTGSDVRIATGEIMAPKQYPRQSVAADWWEWKEAFTRKWQRKEHINLLELRSVLLAIQFQISRFQCLDSRIFHIADSYVCISIISKGRSGSKVLTRVLQQISAHCLAFGLYVVLAHVDSMDNPTDEGSRR